MGAVEQECPFETSLEEIRKIKRETIGVVGAGGKMGTRALVNLAGNDCTLIPLM